MKIRLPDFAPLRPALLLLGLAAGSAVLAASPAQAQFFDFPFFRPRPPAVIPNAPRRDRYGGPNRFEQPRTGHRLRPRVARPKSKPAEAQSAALPGQEAKPDLGPPETPPPYEPQVLRLAEILGALSHLRAVCGEPDAEQWRARMGNFIEAEAKSAARKEKLAGAYNRGFRGYEMSHRACTAGARTAIQRFMREGEKLTHDIAERYNAS